MKHRLPKKLLICAAAGLSLLLTARQGRAQITPAEGYTPPDDTPKVSVGGTLFLDYTYQDVPTGRDADGNVIHSNAFNVSRAYINVTGQLNHLIAFRITPDITRQTFTAGSSGASLNTSGNLVFRVKYAYGQLNLDDFTTKGSWMRLGAQQTPWVDFIDTIYRYRLHGTPFEVRGHFLS